MNCSEKIYYAIFKNKIPPILQKRFEIASDQLMSYFSPQEAANYLRAVNKISDLEALEIVARYTKKLPLLTLNFRLMIVLAETLPENRKFYINKKDNLIYGFLSILIGFLRTLIKVIIGIFLFRTLKNG